MGLTLSRLYRRPGPAPGLPLILSSNFEPEETMGKLIETYRGVIYPWQCDHQGHLNTAQ